MQYFMTVLAQKWTWEKAETLRCHWKLFWVQFAV